MAGITDFINQYGMHFYLYYAIFLFILFALFLFLNVREIKKHVKVKKKWALSLVFVLASFLLAELILVKPTIQVYKDEYIEMSIAKAIIYNHEVGICSFNFGEKCMSDGIGLFQQSVGWPFMLSIPFFIFGVSFSTAYNFTLLIASISIVLVFLVSYLITSDPKAAILSAVFMAFTPLFMTFARSTTLDVNAGMFFLFTLFSLLLYIKNLKMKTGFFAIATAAFSMLMRIEMGIFIPVLLALVSLPNLGLFSKKKVLSDVMILAGVFFLIAAPQFAFIYNSNAENGFGAPNNVKFSYTYFHNYIYNNTIFWLGALSSVNNYGYTFHDEWPLAYTILAVIGGIYLLKKSKKLLFSLAAYFFFVFFFFTSFYAGGAIIQLGVNMRYYIDDFAIVAIFAGIGAVYLSKKIGALIHKKTELVILFVLAAALFMPAIYIKEIVAQNPSNIYPFAADREELNVIESVASQIPNKCIVLSYDPQVWYLLNKSSMFADWFIVSKSYREQALNLSNKCLYFQYSTACLGFAPYPNGTNVYCGKIVNETNMSPLVEEPFNKFGWNFTIGIYRITGFKNGTTFAK
ncbi:MAG: glycosyltransferase family 39 protein [Candidatus Micrarchaeaceae archaeon]